MSKYILLTPASQINLSSKYIVANWSLMSDSITGDRLAPRTITADRITNQTITADQITPYTTTKYQIAANTILLQKLFPDLVTLILQHRIYVHQIMDTGRILQVDETGSVCQFAQQLTISGGSQIGTAFCYTGFGGFMYTTNSNVNSVNQQQSLSSMIQLDTTKKLNDGGCYGMHFTNTYYNQSIFMGFVGSHLLIVGSNGVCCFFAQNTYP